MKKAQVLSALALAFALGVVAPVVTTANTVSAYSEEDSTATYGDTSNALAYVINNSDYKSFLAIRDAAKLYEQQNGRAMADFTAGQPTRNAKEALRVYDAVRNTANVILSADVATYFGFNAADMYADIDAEAWYLDQAKAAISYVEDSEWYSLLADVIKAIEAKNEGNLKEAVKELRNYVSESRNGFPSATQSAIDAIHYNDILLSQYSLTSNPIRTIVTGSYDYVLNIYNAVKAADEAIEKYEYGYNQFMPLLKNSGIVTREAKEAMEAWENPTLANFYGIATNVKVDTNRMKTTPIIRYAEWEDLDETVQEVTEKRYSENSADNYSLIQKLAYSWKGATGNEDNVKDVMKTMVSYKAPTTPSDDNKDDEKDKELGNFTTPDTGVLAGSENGAASTVATVAGIATALTAAGAGVVAYRNARRSTRK